MLWLAKVTKSSTLNQAGDWTCDLFGCQRSYLSVLLLDGAGQQGKYESKQIYSKLLSCIQARLLAG